MTEDDNQRGLEKLREICTPRVVRAGRLAEEGLWSVLSQLDEDLYQAGALVQYSPGPFKRIRASNGSGQAYFPGIEEAVTHLETRHD